MHVLFYFYKFSGWLFNLLVVIFGGLVLAAGIYATIETSKFSFEQTNEQKQQQ